MALLNQQVGMVSTSQSLMMTAAGGRKHMYEENYDMI